MIAPPNSEPSSSLRQFTKALFPRDEGFIEVRLLEERKGGRLVDRRWYLAASKLLDDLPRLFELAEQRGAGVFFGVLRRQAAVTGRSEDTLSGSVVWVDLDFKDFPEGPAEARRALDQFPIQPSFVVMSGHGLHAYWLLREDADPSELSRASKRLAEVLGGDHAFDAARILRLPGSINRKNGECIQTVIETLDPERAYNLSEIEDAADLVGPGNRSRPQETHPNRSIGALDPRVLAVLDQSVRIRALFEGRGKTELGADGKRADTTSSGYDFSLALALGRKGVVERDLLINAVWNRPDQAGQAKGRGYVERTVDNALARLDELKSDALLTDFEVERVRVFDSNPPIYELTIEGERLCLRSGQLACRRSFRTLFMNALRRIPTLPSEALWPDLVNAWLKDADVVEQPPEASEEPALREAAQDAIENLPEGSERIDLDHGKCLRLPNGEVGFKVVTLLRVLREDFPKLVRAELCRVLRDLGFENEPQTVEGKSTRTWFRRTGIRAGGNRGEA